ncbi:MAG: sigma-70 family RNA polymerase sigma factor [Acidobacteriota bacterium]|nr:sigma-70 family RNA polymerase sigma factor [Acidobacteriota bacterium]
MRDAGFEQLVREHQAMVFRTLTRLTGTTEHVEDLAQEAFLRLYRALPAFRGEALVSTYLYRIVVNVAQNEWKRRRRDDRPLVSLSEPLRRDDGARCWEDRLPDQTPDAAAQMQHAEFARTVEEELHRLSNVERAVVVLYHQEERSYVQISCALGLPIGTVRTHLHRARKKLREAIAARQAPLTAHAPQPGRQTPERSPAWTGSR